MPLQDLCLQLAEFLRTSADDTPLAQTRLAQRRRRQTAARAHVANWRTRAVTPLTWVKQDAFANRLIDLIDKPQLMQQEGFPTCAPVAGMMGLLYDYPDEMAKFATALFERGGAMLGKAPLSISAEVRACSESEIIRQCAAVKHPAPPGADWLLFSSLLSTIHTKYTGLPQNGGAGPAEIRVFLDTTKLYKNIDIPRTRSSLDTHLASKRPNDNQLILIFLNSSMISNKGEDVIPTPEHLVYLENVETFIDKGDDWAVFSLYSWGKRITQPFEVAEFMKGVRGYIYGERSY